MTTNGNDPVDFLLRVLQRYIKKISWVADQAVAPVVVECASLTQHTAPETRLALTYPELLPGGIGYFIATMEVSDAELRQARWHSPSRVEFPTYRGAMLVDLYKQVELTVEDLKI